MEPSEVPLAELWEADLDGETLRQLFVDLEAVAQVHEVRLKRGGGHSDGAAAPDLSRARLLLEAGAVSGVQILYAHEGALWLDTLMRYAGKVRLVRTRAPTGGD